MFRIMLPLYMVREFSSDLCLVPSGPGLRNEALDRRSPPTPYGGQPQPGDSGVQHLYGGLKVWAKSH